MKQFEANFAFTHQPPAPHVPVLLWTLWRSGTHWLAQMLCDMTGMNASYLSEDSSDYKQETLEQIAAIGPGQIVIRHICLEPGELLNLAERRSMRVIFLYRDPRDVIVSSIHMRKYREGYRQGLPPFPDMSTSDILAWELEHLRDAYARLLPTWAEAEHPRLAKVRYEDLHADACGVLRRIADFLEFRPSEEHITQVVAENAFDRLTGRSKGIADASAHARRGTVGEFRTFFTKSDLARIDALLGDAIQRMGYAR